MMAESDIDFTCRVCGCQCAIAPDPPERAVCPDHCEDHDYVYDPRRRSRFCSICDAEVPADWYDESGGLSPSEAD